MQTVGDSDTKSFARKKKKKNLSTEEKNFTFNTLFHSLFIYSMRIFKRSQVIFKTGNAVLCNTVEN